MTVKQAIKNSGAAVMDSPYVINPEQNQLLGKWDQVTIVALVFVALVTPVEVGMMETKLDALFVINRVVDAVFGFDMFLQFFIMYPIKTNFGNSMEGNHCRIIRRYLRGWFLIDFLSIQQFDVLGFVFESDSLQKMKLVKIIRLLRLLKLMKVSIATRIFRRLETRVSIAYQRVALYKFLIVLLLISHWLSCLWALTLNLVDESEKNRWTDAIDALDPEGVKTRDSLPHLYIASLYFISYTITSVGYGDLGPVNTVERIVCTVMIFTAGISWAYVLGQVCGIVGSMGIMEQEFRKSMDDLNYMMQDRELPQPMRRRLRSFFLSTRDMSRHNQQQSLLQKMSPALQGEVAMATSWVWLRKVPFMASLLDKVAMKKADERTPCYVVDLAIALATDYYAQSEIFGKPKVLYILQKGLCQRRMRVLRSGSVWGEDFVLSNSKMIHESTCFALTYVEVSYIERGIFLHIVHKWRKTYPELQQNIRRFIARLTMHRGILLEARRRQIAQGKRPCELIGSWMNVEADNDDDDA
jgi:hypothetical protein